MRTHRLLPRKGSVGSTSFQWVRAGSLHRAHLEAGKRREKVRSFRSLSCTEFDALKTGEGQTRAQPPKKVTVSGLAVQPLLQFEIECRQFQMNPARKAGGIRQIAGNMPPATAPTPGCSGAQKRRKYSQRAAKNNIARDEARPTPKITLRNNRRSIFC